MDKDVKEDWLEALRSGEYVQGRGFLDKNDKQCCLGVLCDVMDLPFVAESGKLRRYADVDSDGSRFFSGTMPPGAALAVGLGAHEETLVTMNDPLRCTFDEIADWIEANL